MISVPNARYKAGLSTCHLDVPGVRCREQSTLSNMKIAFIFSTLLVFMFSIGGSTASACTCIPPNPKLTKRQQVGAALKNSGAVFSAKIVAVKISDAAQQQVTYTIEVIRVWKGKVPRITTISTGSNSAMCGSEFIEGETYLIYAGDGGKDGFFTNYCTRTARLNWTTDLKFLGKGRSPMKAVDKKK